MRRVAILVAGLLLVACSRRNVDAAAEALRAALAGSDRAWIQRDVGGLGPVSDALVGFDHTIPEVAWRLTRVELTRGLLAEDLRVQRRAYAEARALGVGCLLAVPTVERAWDDGAQIEAIRAVPSDRVRCAAWAGYAWARWITTWEQGAAEVDVETIRALLARGSLDATQDLDRSEITVWAGGLVDAAQGLVPKTLLDAHRRDNDDAWVWWADVQRWLPSAPQVLIPGRSPAMPEERVAYAQLLKNK